MRVDSFWEVRVSGRELRDGRVRIPLRGGRRELDPTITYITDMLPRQWEWH